MIENFATLEDIFKDDLFDLLVEDIKPKKNIVIDGEIEKFQEIIDWMKEHGTEPTQSKVMKERKLYSRLKRIRNNPDKWMKYKEYDIFNLLGGEEDAR